MGSKPSPEPTAKTKTRNSAAFAEAARALGCDEDPAHFDEALKKVARHKPPSEPPKEPTIAKAKKAAK